MVPESNNPESTSARRGGRIHLAPDVSVAGGDLDWSFVRSSGPGGQNVNKLSTKAELRVRVDAIDGLDDGALARLRDLAGHRAVQDGTVILIQCDETRSQRRNREAALERLRDLIARAVVKPKLRRKRRPGRAAIERRLERKRRQAEKKSRRGWTPE